MPFFQTTRNIGGPPLAGSAIWIRNCLAVWVQSCILRGCDGHADFFFFIGSFAECSWAGKPRRRVPHPTAARSVVSWDARIVSDRVVVFHGQLRQV